MCFYIIQKQNMHVVQIYNFFCILYRIHRAEYPIKHYNASMIITMLCSCLLFPVYHTEVGSCHLIGDYWSHDYLNWSFNANANLAIKQF